jgi:hypothetical protein
MLGIVTTLSAIEVQPSYSRVQLKVSTAYLINTDNIISMKLYSTNDSEIKFSWNMNDDQRIPDKLYVAETNAAIQTLADVAADSNMISLPVFEDTISFAAAASLTAVARLFNITDVVFVEQDSSGTMCKALIVEGGFNEQSFIVDYSIAQIMDILTTGTTTTTTTTTTTSTTSTTTTSA